jgi:HSP20 family protein
VDIYETPDNLVINVELPGLDPGDVILELKDNRLTLAGKRKFPSETSRENYLMAERAHGSFRRSFSMSNNIDGEKITAKFSDGILEINLAKKEESKSRSIPVQTD